MRKLIVAAMGTVAAFGAQAGTFKLDNADVAVGGGAAGGLFLGTNVGSQDNANIQLSDYLLTMKTNTVGKSMGVAFEGAIGDFRQVSLYDAGVGTANQGFGVQYGWMSVSPVKELRIDMGRIATTIGLESAYSLANDNILRGLVWGAQPTFYSGARATYALGDLNVFAEFAEKITNNNDAIAVGVNGTAGKDISYGFTYLNTDKGVDYIDALGKMNAGGVEIGGNIDIIMIEKEASATGKSASAFGLAAYAKFNAGDVAIPVRVEFVSDSDKTVYGHAVTVANPVPPPATITGFASPKSGFSLTVTPTIKAGENGFVRAELAFVNSSEKIFADKDGAAQTNQIAAAVQAGYRF